MYREVDYTEQTISCNTTAKVTRCALQNAASIAGLMLTTEALISEIQEDDDKPGAMSGGMGGGMGM